MYRRYHTCTGDIIHVQEISYMNILYVQEIYHTCTGDIIHEHIICTGDISYMYRRYRTCTGDVIHVQEHTNLKNLTKLMPILQCIFWACTNNIKCTYCSVNALHC